LRCLLSALAAAYAASSNAQTAAGEQAAAGREAYAAHCASCHGDALEGVRYGPPLKGDSFAERWSGKPVQALYEYTATNMPEDNPGGLDAAVYAATLAYILQQNGVAPGPLPLSATAPPEALLPPMVP
jgi:mono/diheme cytochrome c family protein